MVGACLKPVDRYLGSLGPTNLSFNPNHVGKVQFFTSKRALTVQAAYRYQLSLFCGAYCFVVLVSDYDIQNEAQCFYFNWQSFQLLCKITYTNITRILLFCSPSLIIKQAFLPSWSCFSTFQWDIHHSSSSIVLFNKDFSVKHYHPACVIQRRWWKAKQCKLLFGWLCFGRNNSWHARLCICTSGNTDLLCIYLPWIDSQFVWIILGWHLVHPNDFFWNGLWINSLLLLWFWYLIIYFLTIISCYSQQSQNVLGYGTSIWCSLWPWVFMLLIEYSWKFGFLLNIIAGWQVFVFRLARHWLELIGRI